MQGQLNFSRDMEREADRIGFGVHDRRRLRAAGHGGDVREAGARLAPQRQRRLSLPAQPPADDRAHRRGARARAARRPPRRRAAAGALRARADAGARARADGPDASQALRRWQDRCRRVAACAAARAAGALYAERAGVDAAARLARAPSGARRRPLALAQAAPQREPQAERALPLLQVQALLARGDAPAALQALDASTSTQRRARRAAARAGRARPAAPGRQCRPRTLRQQHRGAADLGRRPPARRRRVGLLAATSDALGQQLRALRADAEARAALGDLTGAIDRLRAGQRLARSAGGAGLHRGLGHRRAPARAEAASAASSRSRRAASARRATAQEPPPQ